MKPAIHPHILMFLLLPLAHAAEADWTHLEKQFDTLPMEARRLTGPLFWMHGDESPGQLTDTLQKVLEGGNGTFTAESRPHSDWLGEGWYRDLAVNLDFARKNNLTMTIFDDPWWPSQMMGGRVLPQYGSKKIVAAATRLKGPAKAAPSGYDDPHLIAVVAGLATADGAIDGRSLVDLTSRVKDGTLEWDAPAGDWSVMKFTWDFVGPVGTQRKFISVDGASPDCVDWFLKTVYQPHYDRFKADFGKTINGFFYDEPETQGDWGSDVPRLVAERKLDLAKLLVGYKFRLAGDEQLAARYAYLDAFAESWGRTMYGGMSRWCKERGVFSIGHFMEHDDCLHDRTFCAGNLMQLQKHSDMGGIDLVCHQLYPGGRNMKIYQTAKIASSVSHTYNKRDDLAMCEIYGGYDQKLTYPDMKWLADWHQVRGVNYLIPHSFNPRAPYDNDYPPYFDNGSHEPRWPLYRIWADYTNRLSLMLTGGRHVCPVAFLQVGQSIHVGKARRPEELTSALQDALFDCDWLLYDAWEDDSTLEGNSIRLHKEDYQILVLPAVEVIPYPTLAKARRFFENGGVVVAYDRLPDKSATLGRGSEDIAGLCREIWGDAAPSLARCKTSKAGGRSYFLPAKPSSEDIRKVLVGDAGIHPTLDVVSGETNDWLHVLHRKKNDRDVFLVCNQNHEGKARDFTFRITAAGEPECWDPMRNEITSVPFRRVSKGCVEVDLTLEPSESVLLVFSPEKRQLPTRLTAEMKPKRIIPLREHAAAESAGPRKRGVVLKATYGVPGDAARSRDVRAMLQSRIDAGERRLEVKRLAEGDDPAHGVVKTLVAECEFGGTRVTLTGTDPQTIFLTDKPAPAEQALIRDAKGRPVNFSPASANPFDGTCEIPADIDLANARIYLEMDDLSPEQAASITINGQPAGGLIGKPLRLNVSQHLKPGANTLRIAPFRPKSARLAVY